MGYLSVLLDILVINAVNDDTVGGCLHLQRWFVIHEEAEEEGETRYSYCRIESHTCQI